MDWPQWAYYFGALLGATAGAYGAIRYDLGRLHERATHAQSEAERAHGRIDDLFKRGGSRHG